MDNLVFFRDATLRICSGLELSSILENCYYYLREFIPIDAISMGILDPDNKVLRTTRFFSQEKGISKDFWDKPIKLSPEAWKFLNDFPSGKCHMVNDARKTLPGQAVSKSMGFEELSYLTMELIDLRKSMSRSWYGVVAIFAKGLNRFTEEHARLLEMLHDPFAIALSNTLQYEELIRLKDLLKDDIRFLNNELHNSAEQKIIGQDSSLKDIVKMIRTIAPLNNTVLLLGETGVGKEVAANALHFSSTRSSGPFIKVNCGAIPESLIDSELFGHIKGAFTGAVSDKRGRFERAHNGTIFLDEIGDLPLSAQVRLLRIIQFKELERVGGSDTIKVDVRIIAATNRDIKTMVSTGKFREDLWFRISAFPIQIPPLRQRREDIPALASYFIERKAREFNLNHLPNVSPEAMLRLQSYDWPGNVRELENAVERAVIHNMVSNQSQALYFEDFSVVEGKVDEMNIQQATNEPLRYEDNTRRHILRVLDMTGGKIHGKDGAAAILNINPNTLRFKMRKLGIPFGRNK